MDERVLISESTHLMKTDTRTQPVKGTHDPTIVEFKPSYVKDENYNACDKQGEQEKVQSGFKLFRSLSGRRKYTLILITLATFLESICFSLLGPFYATEAVKKGMNITTVGFVFGIFQVVIFLTAPIYGSNLVKLGPRFVFISGIFLAGSCVLLFGTLEYCPSGTPFIVMSVLIRCVEALGFSGFLTSSLAIVSSEFKDSVAFTFGILKTGAGLGYMLGPTIGGALYSAGGFGVPFYFAGTGVLLNGLAVYKFLPHLEVIPTKRKGSMLTLLKSPAVVIPLFSVLVGVGGITAYDSTFAKHLEPMNFSVGVIGVIFGVVALVYSIMSTVWGYISDTKNLQSPLIVIGHLVFGIGFSLLGPNVLLPFIPFNLTTVIIGLACIGASMGTLFVPTMKCMVIGTIELGFADNLDTYALVSGLFSSFETLGGFIGPVGVGYVIQELDFRVGYTVIAMCSFFMMIVSLVFFTLRRLRKKRVYRNLDGLEL